MSMPKIEKSDNPIEREQSVSNLVESVALMETGLSHIINAEGEKIQKVIKHDDPSADVPLEDILKVNNSAEKMINSISKLEMILQNKLETSKDLDIIGTPGPAGPQGEKGDSATIFIEPAVKLPYTEEPYVNNIGDEHNAKLVFGIPAGEPGEKGDQGEQGEQGPIGPAAVTEFATYFLNSNAKYNEGDLMFFGFTLSESKISIDSTRTKITLGNKNYYKLSYGLNIQRVDRGQPRLEVLMNGKPIPTPASINISTPGNTSVDLVYRLEPQATISFLITNGDVTLANNYTGITNYVTITSIG